MTRLALDIDEIVRQVLAQLGLASPGQAAQRPPAAEPAAQANGEAHAADADHGQLLVASRVVTLAELKDRLATVRKVVVAPRAIVTPAVRDELIRRKIALVVGQQSSPSEKAPAAGHRRLVLMAVGSALEPAPLVAALQKDGIAVEVRRSDCLIRATGELADELRSGETLAVLATSYTAAALCLANRLAGVRAVLGADATTVERDTASVGANLLVVNSAPLGTYPLKQLVSRFYHEPRHECPEVFAKNLG